MASTAIEELLHAAVADSAANQRRAGEYVEEFATRMKRVVGRPFAKLDDLDDLSVNVDPDSVPEKEEAVA